MINIDELWIGDELIHQNGKKRGYFEGTDSNGLILLRTNEGLKKFNPTELEMAPEYVLDIDLNLESEPQNTKESITSFRSNTLDLHIHTLAPQLLQGPKERIFSYQLDKFNEFLEWAIDQKLYSIQIIHGKGEGILRDEIRNILKFHPSIRLWQSIQQDGATEIWLK
ncbi:MAG: Smr/MutS family protein [Saprospiraceae bacterium]|nr:Smr/MutS family protein [Saprospiraceae bacterium]